MTTPIEVAALAVDSLPWDGQHGGVDPDSDEIARAVFESIGRDELATAINRAEKATKTGSKPQRQRLIAEYIIAYLTGDQS